MHETRSSMPMPPRLRAALGAIAVYFLIQIATFIVVGIAYALIHLASATPAHLQDLLRDPHTRILTVVVALPVSCALSLLVLRAWFHRQWKAGAHVGIGIRPIRLSAFTANVLLGIATLFASGLLTLLVSRGHPPVQDIRQIIAQAALPMRLVLALTAVALVPLVEEVLFRGILLPALIRHLPVLAAVAIDASLFALVHLPDFDWKPQGLLGLALVGGVCCWRRLKTGSIFSSVAVHAGNNLLAMVVLLSAAH